MKKYLFFTLILISTLVFDGCKNAITDKNKANKDGQIEISQTDDNDNKKNTSTDIFAKKQVPVLCYHRIENGRNDDYTVTPAAFAAQMQILVDSGYHSISPDQLYDYLVFNKELPEKPVMITFDDSRVEHATIAAPEMEKRGLKGVFFIMTITYNKKNYMTTDEIASLAKSGHTIGLHTWDHTQVTKYINDSILKKELVDPKKKLEEIIGQPVNYLAYPYGITNHAMAVKMNDYFKMSFILSTKQDPEQPLQTIRRMIVPSGWSPQGMLRVMRSTFGVRKN